MERYQVVDTIDLVEREMGIDTVCPGSVGNQPTSADPTLEFVTVERVGPVHDKLKIIELSPLPMAGGSVSFLRVHFIKPRMDALLFRALEV